ncbi:hypothetical protein HWV62_33063 [Athelia sp. TMB]|nr:hypothetical protein HWV62_33063 [Athelia sp. TMB]
MAKSLPSHRTRPALYASRNWLTHHRRTPASSSPSKSLCDSYYVDPSPRPRHERHGEFPMMLPDEEAVAKEADLLFLNDLTPFRLQQLYAALQGHNKSHTISTYCEDAKDWVPWTGIPFHTQLDGTRVPYAASSWERVGIQKPLYCPHVSNGFRPKKDCEMQIYRDSTLGKGKERWVARARQHNCRFMVVIPCLDSLKEVFTKRNKPVSTSSSQTSTSNISAGLPPSSPLVTPSSSRTGNTASSSRLAASSPSRRPRLDNFYDSDEILERSDLALKTAWMSSASRLRYHPANDREWPPEALYHYHPISSPDPFTELGLANSMIGMAMKYFNSPEGISPTAHHLAFSASTLCTGCRNQFSIDGFRQHIAPEGYCSNPKFTATLVYTPPPIHPAADGNKPPHALMEFHPSSNPSPPEETFEDSMITRALLEWNSRIGIPQDAWDTVATARVQCHGCNRVRSFDGDAMHRDVHGLPLCGGPPMDRDDDEDDEDEDEAHDEEAHVQGKGKGRAI